MPNYWPAANGNWSTLSNWLTATGVTAGTLPGIADDVFADGRTVTIDISPQVSTIRTTQRAGGTAGGGFVLTSGVSLTANVIAGSTACLSFALGSPNTATLIGSISAGTATTAHGISFTGTGTLNVVGSATGGFGGNGPSGISHTSTGTLNFVGNVYGAGSTSVNGDGIVFSSTGTVNITGNIYGGIGTANTSVGLRITGNGVLSMSGNVFGGTSSNCSGISYAGTTDTVSVTGNILGGNSSNTGYGLVNSNVGTIRVYGNITGGIGAVGSLNNSTGRLFVYGNAIGGNGSNISGVINNSTGFVFVTKAKGNDFGLGSVGIAGGSVGLANSQNGLAYIEQAEFGPRGQTPISGPVYILPSNRNTLTGVLTALGNTVTFYNSLSVDGLMPPTSSVQLGTVYNVGNSVGTMAVPSASAVEFGVPVDNTVGVAALTPQTVWGYSRLSATDVGSMGDRLRNAATAQSVGSQIASFNL